MPDLPPNTTNPLRMFIRSSFLTKPVPLPESARLDGETTIVTGSNVGIGLATVSVLLQHGTSRVIMAVRSVDKGEKAAEPLRKKFTQARIDVWHLDLMSYESVQKFTQRCDDELSRLDRVMLNAGVAMNDFLKHPETGHEEMIQVNYLSTALLAFLLIPILKKKRGTDSPSPARMTFVTSTVGLGCKFTNRDADPLLPSFDQVSSWGTAAALERYGASKLLLLFLTQKLGRIISDTDIIINVVEPGMVVKTDIARHAPGLVATLTKALGAVASRTVEQGAWTFTDALCAKGPESHGSLIMDWRIVGYPPVMHGEQGQAISERLWKETLAEFSFANVAATVDADNFTDSPP